MCDWRSDGCSSDLVGVYGKGQVEPVDRPFNMSSDMVHDTNHQRRVFRILEMRVICVAITEMETELHAGRHPGRDLEHSADQCIEIADRCRKDHVEEIGRATCRGRVSPYVVISVVAGYLKKKTNI